MALTPATIGRLINKFQGDLERARTLHDRIAVSGATQVVNGTYSPLLNPDRRDAAQFIFFEAAAEFESFCTSAFRIEVRHMFNIQPRRADHVMGSIDRGLAGTMGWASPTRLKDRAQALFGKSGFFGRLDVHLGVQTWDRLTYAHKVRNRIAHTGGNASKDFNQILGSLQVPVQSRKGLGVGRLLLDYPQNVQPNDRWFFRFIGAYLALSNAYRSHMEKRGLLP